MTIFDFAFDVGLGGHLFFTNRGIFTSIRFNHLYGYIDLWEFYESKNRIQTYGLDPVWRWRSPLDWMWRCARRQH